MTDIRHIEEYLKKRIVDCKNHLDNNRGLTMIIGNSESGKSFLLREMYNLSGSDLKIFQGGVVANRRKEMLVNILYNIKKNKNARVKELYLDEFDDSDSMNFINSKFIEYGIKVVNTTKLADACFGNNLINIFHIDSRDLNRLLLDNSNLCDKIKKADALKFEVGDWLYFSKLNLEILDCKTIEEIVNRKKEEIHKKSTFMHSLCLIETRRLRTVTVYDYRNG